MSDELSRHTSQCLLYGRLVQLGLSRSDVASFGVPYDLLDPISILSTQSLSKLRRWVGDIEEAVQEGYFEPAEMDEDALRRVREADALRKDIENADEDPGRIARAAGYSKWNGVWRRHIQGDTLGKLKSTWTRLKSRRRDLRLRYERTVDIVRTLDQKGIADAVCSTAGVPRRRLLQYVRSGGKEALDHSDITLFQRLIATHDLMG